MPKTQTATKGITYDEALAELQQIVSDMEDEQISIDHLSDKVRRAAELIASCRAKLRQTEELLENSMEQF